MSIFLKKQKMRDGLGSKAIEKKQSQSVQDAVWEQICLDQPEAGCILGAHWCCGAKSTLAKAEYQTDIPQKGEKKNKK